jgi:hypothetical protein
VAPIQPARGRACEHGDHLAIEPQQAVRLRRVGDRQRAKGAGRRRPRQTHQINKEFLHVPIASLATRNTQFPGGANLHCFAVESAQHQLPKFFKRLSPLFAAPAALLLTQGQAKAVLTYSIFESAGNVVVQASGRLDLTGADYLSDGACGVPGGLISSFAVICTGPNSTSSAYSVSGPKSFNGSVLAFPASSVSGTSTTLDGGGSKFYIDPAYLSTTPIVSSATFNGETLASLGFTTTGLIGTWSLTGTSETIQVYLGNPPAAAVPGPLPLLGIGAAFGWSRRLRKRIAAPLITPSQA